MRRVIFAALSTIAGLVMLLSFKSRSTPTAVVATTPAVSNSGASTNKSGAVGGGRGGTPSSTTTGSASSTGTETELGVAANTRYGPVQVKITVRKGEVTAVEAVEYPEESPRDQQINSYAIPELNQAATAAKGGDIDLITGATYTSTGYITSLQSALNEAGLK
jgi:uncharacterized protein with FMN-binding domain